MRYLYSMNQTANDFIKAQVTIRDAREDDAEFLAQVILAAAHLSDMGADTTASADTAASAATTASADTPNNADTANSNGTATSAGALTAICRRTDTLYSWHNARIACACGKRAGAMVSYPGDIYLAARSITFPLLPGLTQAQIDATDIETLPGEWYLDSLAVLPEFRRAGLGKMLVMDAIERGRNAGYAQFTLLAEKSSTHLVEYYTRLGFAIESSKLYLGNAYWRMVRR